MQTPRMAAEALLTDYFAWRGQATPDADARNLLRQVRVIDGTRWFPRKYVEDAIALLRRGAFNVEEVATDFLGVDLRIDDLSRFDALTGAPVYGLAHPDEWSICICHRARAYKPLFRATIAHEIGHLQLHAKSAAFSPASSRRPRTEFEADTFMHTLLAPPSLLHMALSLVCHLYSRHYENVVLGANSAPGRHLWRHFVLPILVNNLCVSRQLLCLKFLELGVINQESLQFHMSYVMPNIWLQQEHRDAETRVSPLDCFSD